MKYFSKILLGVAVLGFGIVSIQGTTEAHASYFNYYQNNKPKKYHKTYTSKKTYKINKTYSFNGVSGGSYKLKVKNLYVYQVSKKNSAYATWAKVTGTAYNNNVTDSYRFGEINMYGPIPGKAATISTNTYNFSFSQSTSYSPKMLSPLKGVSTSGFLKAHSSESYELLMHTKKQHTKIGKATLTLKTIGDGLGDYANISVNLK